MLQIRVTALNKVKLELQSQITEQQEEMEKLRETLKETQTQVALLQAKVLSRGVLVRVDDEIEIRRK